MVSSLHHHIPSRKLLQPVTWNSNDLFTSVSLSGDYRILEGWDYVCVSIQSKSCTVIHT